MTLRALAPLALTCALMGCGGSITITLPTMPGLEPVVELAPNGYERLFSPAPHAVRAARTGEPVRRGATAERYELREGDCGGSDCGAGRARAEIVELPDQIAARLNRDIWIGWSFYNETIRSVPREDWLGTVIAGWRVAGDQPSVIRLVQQPLGAGDLAACSPGICTAAGVAADDVWVQLDAMRQTMGWGPAQNDGNICRLFGMDAVRGRWVDIVMNTNFGTDGFGYLRIWVDGELRCNYAGQIVPPGPAPEGAGPSHRRGIFNSFTQRWVETHGAAPKPTLIAYVDEFMTGLARADVDPALRAATGAAPLD